MIGRGTTVGRPLGLLLTRKSENATVTLCHTGTVDVAEHTRQADIVVAAAGRPGLVTADMIKPGAVCVDVGITRTEAGLVGDLDASVARGGVLGRAGARRRRSDDPGDAAHQRGRARRAAAGADHAPGGRTGLAMAGDWHPSLNRRRWAQRASGAGARAAGSGRCGSGRC